MNTTSYIHYVKEVTLEPIVRHDTPAPAYFSQKIVITTVDGSRMETTVFFAEQSQQSPN